MTPEQQRKMLEYAAKAVFGGMGNQMIASDWNPRTNPADTAEMCAKLRISTLYEHDPCEFLSCFAHNSHDPEIAHYKDHDNSRLRAWMFAATICAAKAQGYEP